jgi:flagellar biosynthesis chaperone FliJ
MSGEEFRQTMATEKNFDIKSSYVIAQVSHIVCKKVHHEILSNTVSERLSEGYEKLVSQKIILKPPHGDAKVQAVIVPKDARNVRVESKENNPEKCHIANQISGSSFTMMHCDEKSFPAGSDIILILPPFELFIIEDLSFYADVLGMPNSSSYWCPWCFLSHPEWNRDPTTFAVEERTLKFLSNTVEDINKDSEKKLKPMDRKGVLTERHYNCLGPENFVPPLLHLEIGMVNQCRESFEEWVDEVTEIVQPIEKDARKQVEAAKNLLAEAADDKKRCEATINVELREKSGAATLIRSQLWRKNMDAAHREELTMQLTLLDTAITELKNQVKAKKENVKKCQENFSVCKKKVATCREERGKPEASISADIEMVLEKYKASCAANHGGDYNGRKIQLRVTLKAHVIEQHIVPCNNKYRVGDKEESFIELGHQVGLRENHRYQGLKTFRKKTDASLKVRSFDMHPLVKEQAQKVLQSTKRARQTAAIATNKKEKAKTVEKKNLRKKKGSRKK